MSDPIHDLIPHFDPIDPASVIHRARQRRRTTIGALVAVMVVTLAIILVPTVVVPSIAGRTARPADVTVGTPSAVLTAASTTPRSSSSATPAVACGLTALPASWKSALVTTRLTPATQVDLLARDASTGRALYQRRGTPMTISVVDGNGAERTLFELAADQQVFAAAIEGEWAVLTVGSGDGMTILAVLARRVTGGDLVTVVQREAESGPISERPVLYRGVVYLQTGTYALTSSTASMLAFHLDGGQRVLRDVPRQRGALVRVGELLAWSEAPSKATTVLNLTSMQTVAVPPALASLGQAWWAASDGDTVVWEGTGATKGWVRAYRAGWSDVREFALPEQLLNPGLTSWGRYATVLVSDRHWILDLETGQYAPLTTSWGGAVASGGRLATSEMANQKGGSAGLYELDLTTVRLLPICRLINGEVIRSAPNSARSGWMLLPGGEWGADRVRADHAQLNTLTVTLSGQKVSRTIKPIRSARTTLRAPAQPL